MYLSHKLETLIDSSFPHIPSQGYKCVISELRKYLAQNRIQSGTCHTFPIYCKIQKPLTISLNSEITTEKNHLPNNG